MTLCHARLFNRESDAGYERLPFAALFLPMCFHCDAPIYPVAALQTASQQSRPSSLFCS
jgi:hypothetical protein